MKVKVCGLNDQVNITGVVAAGAELVGLIFYAKSPRSVDKGNVTADFVRELDVERVGVFVNEREDRIMELAGEFGLGYLQLHGDESPETCARFRSKGYKVFKAISVGGTVDLEGLEKYEGSIDYLLFDTKGKNRGGNGEKFDWEVLTQYTLKTPFLLSGGLSPEDAENVSALKMDQLWAVDLNSGFESKPGIKKTNELREFIQKIH